MAWASAVSGVTGAFGNAVQGEATYNNDQYNSKVALQNAQITREQAAEDARRQSVQARKTIGAERANYAASGIGLQGSALDVLADSAANAELDRLTILNNGENKSRMYESDSAQDQTAASSARLGGYLGASGQIAGAAGKTYGAYNSGAA